MADTLRLVRMQRAHLPALTEMAEEFRAEGDPRLEAVIVDPEAFFACVEQFERGLDLPPDRVPQYHYLLFRGDRVLGGVRLRHRLIPVLEIDGGNIGYEVRPSERGRGHATAMLGKVLEEARRLPLERVLLTAALTNAPSLRVIEKHGGVRDGTTTSPHTGEIMQRYWIEL